MMKLTWEIHIGKYRLGLLESVKIHSSVDLLADTAEILLPSLVIGKSLDIEKKIKRGDAVSISLGYGDTREEFKGYLNSISTDGGKIVLGCEDSLFLLRKALPNKELKNISVKSLLEWVIREVAPLMSVECSYEFNYEKFVVNSTTGFEILKKVQEETKANIYMKGDVLHIHPAYEEVFGSAVYDFARNVEKDSLTYKRADERAYEVEVEGLTKGGQSVKVTIGTTGGDKRSIKIYGVSDKDALRKRGEEELKNLSYDGFEGDFTGWLVPYCSSGYAVSIKDSEYSHKDGVYYVVAVTTEMSSSGGLRKIQLGRKLK